MRAWRLSIALCALGFAGCAVTAAGDGDLDGGRAIDGSSHSDAAGARDVFRPMPDADAGPPLCPAGGPTVPSSSFCAMDGCNFYPRSFPSCDDVGSDYAFYNQDYCSVDLTVLSIAAGWCIPCMEEAMQIESTLIANPTYAGRVRVVTVMFQNPDMGPGTISFCQQWKARYGLTNPFVIDPTGIVSQYFPQIGLPSSLVIDRNGRLVGHVLGGLDQVRPVIDAQLAL